jgi:membrane-associated phospholipid phosphatase
MGAPGDSSGTSWRPRGGTAADPMRLVWAGFTLLSIAQPLTAQLTAPKSQARQRARTTPVIRVWEAGLLVGLTAGAMAIDQSARASAQQHRTSFRDHLSDFGRAFGNKYYVYPPLLAGTLAGRVFGSKTLERVSWHALESVAIAAGATLVLKSAIGRRRPDVSPDDPFRFAPFSFKFNSLPSGHTSMAFALATSLSAETKDHWTDALCYAVATLTALSRVNDDKHWLSDTLFGAGLGIMSARLVQGWHHRLLLRPGAVGVNLSF